jgi:hypothetical protein
MLEGIDLVGSKCSPIFPDGSKRLLSLGDNLLCCPRFEIQV